MNIRLMGDGNQVADAVAALEKTSWLHITNRSRPYANRRDPDQMRVYLNVEIDTSKAVDAAIGTRGATDLDIVTIDGRREVWLVIAGIGGYVCAEPDADYPDGICGMPVETEPCTIHHADGLAA